MMTVAAVWSSLLLCLFLANGAAGGAVQSGSACPASAYLSSLKFATVPSGTFQASVWACGLQSPRDISVDPATNTVFVGSKPSSPAPSWVVALQDQTGSGFATAITNVTKQVYPNGVEFDPATGLLFVTTQTSIVQVANPATAPVATPLYSNAFPVPNATRDALAAGWPVPPYTSANPAHVSWHSCSLANGFIYASVATGCATNCDIAALFPQANNATMNTVCDPCNLRGIEPRYATILRYATDGTTPLTGQTVATGVRFSESQDFHPTTGDMWFSENGANNGPALSPTAVVDADELDVAAASALGVLTPDYQYPFCQGNSVADFSYWGGSGNACAYNGTAYPCCIGVGDLEALGSSEAPLATKFYRGGMFPVAAFRSTGVDTQLLFVADHGAAVNTQPAVQLVVVENGGAAIQTATFFATGFNTSAGHLWARPVGIGFLSDGSMLISDDYGGNILRVVFLLKCGAAAVAAPLTPGNCTTAEAGPLPSGTYCVLGCAAGYLPLGSLGVTCQNGSYTAPAGVCVHSSSESHSSSHDSDSHSASHGSASHHSHSHSASHKSASHSASHQSHSHDSVSHSASHASHSHASRSHASRSHASHSHQSHSHRSASHRSRSRSRSSSHHSHSHRSHSHSRSGKPAAATHRPSNTTAIIVGVVVGVVAFCFFCFGAFWLYKHDKKLFGRRNSGAHAAEMSYQAKPVRLEYEPTI